MTPLAIVERASLFIVLNAGSGRGEADSARRSIESACAQAGREHRIFQVDKHRRLLPCAREAVERARAVQGVVVAAGGDGTINAVAQATLGSGCAFGVLPQGTFNYFSRTHGIPPAPTRRCRCCSTNSRAQCRWGRSTTANSLRQAAP